MKEDFKNWFLFVGRVVFVFIKVPYYLFGWFLGILRAINCTITHKGYWVLQREGTLNFAAYYRCSKCNSWWEEGGSE